MYRTLCLMQFVCISIEYLVYVVLTSSPASLSLNSNRGIACSGKFVFIISVPFVQFFWPASWDIMSGILSVVRLLLRYMPVSRFIISHSFWFGQQNFSGSVWMSRS